MPSSPLGWNLSANNISSWSGVGVHSEGSFLQLQHQRDLDTPAYTLILGANEIEQRSYDVIGSVMWVSPADS